MKTWHPVEKLARMMRKAPTSAERALWGYLRRQPFGFAFERQFIIGKWIADFFCQECKLVIEVDGPAHGDPRRKSKDFDREQSMAALGITTMRFSNEDILLKIEWIDQEIGLQIRRLGHTPRYRGRTPQASTTYPLPKKASKSCRVSPIRGGIQFFHRCGDYAGKSLSLSNENRSSEASSVGNCTGSIYVSEKIALETAKALKRADGAVYWCGRHWHVKPR